MMNIKLSQLLVGCLLMILSASPASGYMRIMSFGRFGRTGGSRDCFGPRETFRYESCPKHTCEGGLAHSQCCMARSNGGFYVFGFGRAEQCKCDPSVNCHRRPINPPRLEVPAEFPTRDETQQTGARYCSYQFEKNNYKICPMQFCNASGEAECCKRQGFFSVTEMCMCHPQKSCDVSDLPGLEIDCDEEENSDVPECKSQEIEPDDKDTDINDDTGKISGEESKKKSNNISEEDDDKNVETDEKPSLCTDRLRLLNAQKVEDECRYKGVAKLTRVDTNGDALVCNAIYTIAQVEGSVRRTFLTPQACGTLTKDVPEGLTLELQIGDQNYPIPSRIFTTAEGPNGNWYITPTSRYTNLFRDLGACQSNACPYDPKAMRGKVDFNDCKVVSYGASNADTFETDGLREKTIAFYPGGCLEQEDFFGAKETLCFRTVDDKNAFCANDAGGPVYCRASSTQEWILIGTAAFQKDCDKYPDLKVIPFPL